MHTRTRYHPVSMALHWLLALLILGSLSVGLYMTGLPFSPQRLQLYNWHKWAGVVILVLSAARLLWRLVQPPPAMPSMPAWQRATAQGAHLVLYALFFAVPLSGWAYSSAAGFPVVLFAVLPLPDWVPVSRDLAGTLKPIHHYLAYALGAVIGLHVAGALKHHFVDRDGLLLRMWPGRG